VLNPEQENDSYGLLYVDLQMVIGKISEGSGYVPV